MSVTGFTLPASSANLSFTITTYELSLGSTNEIERFEGFEMRNPATTAWSNITVGVIAPIGTNFGVQQWSDAY
jgi:hypothetical protein